MTGMWGRCYWWLPRSWQVWLVARKPARRKRVRTFWYLYLGKRFSSTRLQAGYRFGCMVIGPYLMTDDDGTAYIGMGLGPLFAEVAWNVGSGWWLANLLWGKA